MSTMKDPQYRTTRATALALGVTQRTVQKYCRDGYLPGAMKAGAWCIPQASIDAFFVWVEAGQPDGTKPVLQQEA